MHNALLKAQLGLNRCENSLQQLFMVVHMFGHEEEGGLDPISLESVRGLIDHMRHEFKLANLLLDSAQGLDEPPPQPTHTAIIKEFRQAA